MPQDLMNGQSNNAGKSISLNLDALGDAVNDQPSFASNDEKPFLKEEVEAEIIGTDFRLMSQLSSNQSDPSKKYFNTVFAIETRFTCTIVNENGETETKEFVSRDNYSGLRYFPKFDENGNVMRMADGTPALDRFWNGDTSAFGRLLAIVQSYDSTVRSYADFFAFFNRPGLKCKILTEEVNYQGQKKAKQFIQSFI